MSMVCRDLPASDMSSEVVAGERLKSELSYRCCDCDFHTV